MNVIETILVDETLVCKSKRCYRQSNFSVLFYMATCALKRTKSEIEVQSSRLSEIVFGTKYEYLSPVVSS